jgi:hypothetical protein
MGWVDEMNVGSCVRCSRTIGIKLVSVMMGHKLVFIMMCYYRSLVMVACRGGKESEEQRIYYASSVQ